MVLRGLALMIVTAALAAAQRTPVVVELFTSEGCSSCPPADALLSRLEQTQPVAGVEVIVLGQHVDYWDRLGWPDAFSSTLFTARQSEYAHAFGTENIYTPQMVVQGQVEFVGSEEWRARREIERAARGPRATVEIALNPQGTLALRVADLPQLRHSEKLDIYLAITESGLANEVRGGENAGRQLAHTGVVRTLVTVGAIDPKKSSGFTAEAKLNLQSHWKRENVKAVLFVQGRSSRRILGAASLRL